MKRLCLVLSLLLCTACCATVNTIYRPIAYTCDGTDTTFNFAFDIDLSNQLVVRLVDSGGVAQTLALTTDYSVTATNQDFRAGPGGTVTTTTAYASGYTIVISRAVAQTQDNSYKTTGSMQPYSIRQSLDKLTMIVQDLQEQIRRCLRVPVPDYGVDTNLVPAEQRADGMLAFDDYGEPYVVAGLISPNDVNVSPLWAPVLQETSLADSLAGLGFGTIAAEFADEPTAWQAAMALQTDGMVDIRWCGAIPDDGLNDYGPIKAATDLALANNGMVYFPAGEWDLQTYWTLTCTADLGWIAAPGATLKLSGSGFLTMQADTADSSITLTANVTRKATQLTVDDTSLLTVGDVLKIDTSVDAEAAWGTHKREVHTILSIPDGNTIGLGEPMVFSYATTDAGLTISAYHQRRVRVEGLRFTNSGDKQVQVQYFRSPVFRDCTFEDLDLDNDGYAFSPAWNVDALMENITFIRGGYGSTFSTNRNIIWRNVTAFNLSAHPLAPSNWNYGVYIDGLRVHDCLGVIDSHPSFEVHYSNVIGWAAGVPNLRCIGGSIRNATIYSTGLTGVEYFQTLHLKVDREYMDEAVFVIDGLHIDAPTVDANDLNVRFLVNYGAHWKINDFSMTCSNGKSGGIWDFYAGTGDANGVEDISLTNSRLQLIQIWTGQKVTVNNCQFLSAIDGNEPNDRAVSLGSGALGQFSNSTFTDYNCVISSVTSNRVQWSNCSFRDCHNLGTQLSGTAYHYFTGCLFNNIDHIASTWLANIHASNCYVVGTTEPILEGTVTWNPGSLGDGAGETSSGITVAGALLGDWVLVTAPYDLQDCTVTGYVQASDTIEIRLQNESAGTRDLASGTWRVKVIKP